MTPLRWETAGEARVACGLNVSYRVRGLRHRPACEANVVGLRVSLTAEFPDCVSAVGWCERFEVLINRASWIRLEDI